MLKKILICNQFFLTYSKKNYFFSVFLNLLNSFFQIIGVGSVFLLVSLLINSEFLFNNEYYIKYFPFKEISQKDQIFFCSLIFLIFFLISIIVTHCSAIIQQVLVFKIVNNLRSNLFEYFFNIDTSKKQNLDKGTFSNLFGYTLDKINIFIESYLKLLNEIFLSIFLIFFLININYFLFLIVIFFLIIFYLIFLVSKKKLINISKSLQKINKNLSRLGWYVANGHQEIVLFNRKEKFISNYAIENYKTIPLKIKNYLISSLPRNIVETIILSILILFIIIRSDNNQIINQLPILAATLYCVYRLIPILLSIYRSITQMKSQEYSFQVFLHFFNAADIIKKNQIHDKNNFNHTFDKNLKISNVHFKYLKGKHEESFEYNYLIKKGEFILLKGKSGIGKSTFFNLLSGLIVPKDGKISIDNIDIHKNIKSFWRILGYVPQNSYLLHGTIAWNITYKKNYTKEDINLLKIIFKICELNKVAKNFDALFKTKLITDATHISGGQKQRIQIARILFKKPKLILFDESFNAIDQISEINILKNIKKYFKGVTLILSSHRPIKIKNFFDRTINIK